MKPQCIQQLDTAVCSNRSIFNRLMLLLLSLVLVCVACPKPATAQSSTALTAVYGRGVHAYFAGDTPMAEQHFTEVIQAGSTDPRPYYFRGVLRLNQGRQFEAENDMRIGATYEARNPGVQHAIGRALQRVQGTARRTLEKFRRQARLDRAQQGRQRSLQRYEQLDQRAPAVLRQGTQVPLTQPIQAPRLPSSSGAKPLNAGSGSQPQPQQAPAAIQQIPAESGVKAAESDPFGSPAPVTPADDLFGSGTTGETPVPAASPTPAPTPAPTEADPFGAMPAPVAEEADPFGEMPAETPAPTEEAPAPVEDDPFGDSADSAAAESDDDFFGESSEAEMEADEASEEPADEDDPFGESADDTAGESADESAADDEDPFGESDSSADEDPFGESSSDAADEAPADEDDPFGEGMDDDSDSSEGDSEPEEESSDSSDDTFDDDDPFGPLGSTPTPKGDTFAGQPSLTPTSNSSAGPGGQLFFAMGQWLGSRGNAMSSVASRGNAVAQADFQLGPTNNSSTQTASAEMVFEADFAEPPATKVQPATAAEDEDAFADDPFGDDPFAEL